MVDLDKLLDKAKWDKLTPEEVQYVVQRIENSKPNDPDLYVLIYTLGRSGEIKYRKLVERFLYFPSDPMISLIALKTLCDYWSFTEDYLSELLNFVHGVEWDEENDVRNVAISTLGEHLRQHPDNKLLQLLIDIFENDQDEIDRETAYVALARAMGREYKEIFSSNWNILFDFSVIEEVQKRIKNQQV